MNSISIRNVKTLVLVASALLAVWACNIGGEAKTEEVFTFPTMADSLKGSDRALIYLTDISGDVVDTLFNGPITPATRFENLVARRYDGGKINVVVEGYKDGVVIYKLQKTYDGANSKVDNTVIVIARPVPDPNPNPDPDPNPNPGPATPADSVSIIPDTLKLMANGLKGVLAATVYPDTLPQNVTWNSLDGAIATVSTSGVVSGLQEGVARIVATSVRGGRNADTAVVIVSVALKAESVKFDRAVLEIYLEGSAEPLVVQVLPLGVNPEVVFHIAESGVVEILDGKVKGLKEGQTTVTARSIVDTSLSATLQVVVLPKPSDPVDSVVVAQDTLRLYTGGESLSLTATLYPKTLPARFSWRTASQAIAMVDTAGKVSPIAPGRTFVSAISLADYTRRDSALVIVKRDPPRIQIGGDTTISVGSILTYLPDITQDYGLTTMIRWDLDGNGAWDDSSATPNPVTYAYAEAKEYITRFSARDTEGNDTTVTRKVRSVNGPVIQISQPTDGSYTNLSPVTVAWTVDGVPQTTPEILKVGLNIITRSAKSATGEIFSATVTVNYDTVPPVRPMVKGPSGSVATLRPAWSWEPAGGGNGTYRFRLDSDNFTVGAIVIADTSYTPGTNLTGGPHTLYVQERDQAGNWSPTGSFTVRIDTTPPVPPLVTVLPVSPTNDRTPTWSWTSRGGGSGYWRFKLGDRNMASGATETTTPTHTPYAELAAGSYTLHVQERDSAGNWSQSDSASVTIDLSAPGSPQVSVLPISPTRDQTPTWSWRSGSAATGDFRYKFNDANLNAGAIETRLTSFTPPADLAAGSWIVYVQEKNAAGTWSPSGSASVRIDTTRPAAPTVAVSPASPTSDSRPTWTWNKQEPGIGFFRYRLNTGSLRDTGSTSFRPSLAGQFSEGTYTVYVQEGDSAGNWSSEGSAQVVIDLTPPTSPVVSGPTSPTNDDTPTWNWTQASGSGGNLTFRYRLNDTNMAGGTVTVERILTSATLTAGTHTLYVQERDVAGNWSARGFYTLVIDRTPPGTPVMNTTTPRSPLNSLRPTWSWSSGGGGDNNAYQVKIGNSDFTTGATTVSVPNFTPPANLAQGAQTLYVRERDAAQNWSTAASRTLFLAPRDTLDRLGFSTNESSGMKLVMTSTGIIYAAYQDQVAFTMLVKRYNPGTGTWADAGTGLANLGSRIHDFVLGPNNTPYIVGSNHVMKLAGTTWQNVGDVANNARQIESSYHSLAFNPAGTPFLALVDPNDNYRLNVKRFSGISWDPVNRNPIGGEPWKLNLVITDNGTPFLAYFNLNSVYVVTTDLENYDAKWDTFGSQPVYDAFVFDLKMRSHANQLYLGINNNEEIQIFTSSGGTFSRIHQQAGGGEFDLAIDPTGIPYLLYQRPTSPNDQMTVLARINNSWVPVGAPHQSAGSVSEPTLVISGDGVPHMGFYDQAQGGKPSVIRTAFDP